VFMMQRPLFDLGSRVFNLVLQVTTFLGVVPVLFVKAAIPSFVALLRRNATDMIGLEVAEVCNLGTIGLKVAEVCNSGTIGLKVTEVCNSGTIRLKVVEVCDLGTIELKVTDVYDSGIIGLKVAEFGRTRSEGPEASVSGSSSSGVPSSVGAKSRRDLEVMKSCHDVVLVIGEEALGPIQECYSIPEEYVLRAPSTEHGGEAHPPSPLQQRRAPPLSVQAVATRSESFLTRQAGRRSEEFRVGEAVASLPCSLFRVVDLGYN
ncbi:hypothetical protein B296_00038072, partial [Ensete ventricosum]